MSSIDLLELINQSRVALGESEVRRNDFMARCRDELEGDHYETFVVTNSNGTQSEAMNLTKDQCMLVAMRESKAVRRSVLETLNKIAPSQAPSFAIPPTYAAALRLAADQQEQLETQAKLIEQQRPAVEFLDRFVEAKSTKSLREVAKVLGVKEREFIGRLESDGVLFRQGGSLLPYANHQHSGYFEVKTGESNGHAYHQTRFTPEGVSWVAKKFYKKAAA
jgi:phage antirepressor YoqD-like protein